jgi:hypothetical protein
MRSEEKEFEDFLRGIEFDDTPDYAYRDKLEQNLHSCLIRQKTTSLSIWRRIMSSKITKFAAVICIVIVAVIVGNIFLKKDSDIISIPYEGRNQHFTDELIAFQKMAAIGDIKGLTKELSEGRFESKIVAAQFLAKMGEIPELVEMPALESVSMYAEGDLILDSVTGSLRLRSTKSEDWLEMANGKIKIHKNQDVREAEKVRIIHNIDEDQEGWESHEREFADLRKERADLEVKLAKLNQNTQEDEVKELRERLVKYNELLDAVDNAVYVCIENTNLKLDNPKYHRTAVAELLDGTVKVEWHGHIVEGNSVTFRYNLAPVLTDGPPKPTPGWKERFNAVYSLNEGEIVRWVHTPYIPERQIYATQELHYHSSDNPPPPGYLSFFWDGDLYNWTLAMSELSLATVLQDIGLERYEYRDETPEKLLSLQLDGDWIIRNNASIEDKMLALEKVLQDELDPTITFVKLKMNRDVIIVRGQYKHVPLDGAKDPNKIYVPFNGGGTGSLEKMIKRIGGNINRPFVFETEDLSNIRVSYLSGSYSYSRSNLNSKTSEEIQKILDSALEYLAKQTSLQFEYGQRQQDIWFITE